jgi:hypothetical protein
VKRGDIYHLLHSHDYFMQIKFFRNSQGSTLSSFHFRNLTKFFISDTSTSYARMFFLSFVNSFQVNMILQGRVWIIIELIHFLTDVISSVDRFNLSSLSGACVRWRRQESIYHQRVTFTLILADAVLLEPLLCLICYICGR